MEGFKKASALLVLTPCRGCFVPAGRLPFWCLSQSLHLLPLPVPPGGGCSAPPHCAQRQILGPKGAPGQLLLSEIHWGLGGTSLNCTPLAVPRWPAAMGTQAWRWDGGWVVSAPTAAPLPTSLHLQVSPLEVATPPASLSPLLLCFFFPFPAAGPFPWEPLVGDGRPGEKSQRFRL